MVIKKKIGNILEKLMISDLRKKLRNLLKKYAKTNSAVLDLGCGKNGSLDFDNIKKITLTGYDLRKENIIEFSNKYKKLKVKSGICNIENNKIKGKYDLIIFAGVIQYLNNPEGDLAKIYSSLNKNGILLISTVNLDSLFRRWGIISRDIKTDRGEKKIYSIIDFRKIVEKTGFKTLEIAGSDFLPMPLSLCGNIVIVGRKA